jgi:uncharacterized protein YegL
MKTYVAIVLDKSGSMARNKDKTIMGYNEQVQQLKANAKDQEIYVSLVTFNGEVYEHLWNESADKLNESSTEDYVPNGGTAMRDAVGYTISRLQETTDQNEKDVAYLVIVISDGETLNDRRFSVPQLRELIDGCQASGKWTFTYLGCSADYLQEVSRQTGVPVSNMGVWDNSRADLAIKALRATAVRSNSYFAARAAGATASCNYMSDSCDVADFTKDAPDVDKITLGFGANLTADADVKKESVTRQRTGVFASGNSVDWKKYTNKLNP